MNVRKRITTLLLAICLVLSLVPAVSAADTNTEIYNFDYYDEVVNIKGEGGVPNGDIGNVASIGTVAFATELSDYYASNDLNWNYNTFYRNGTDTKLRLFFYSKNYVKGNPNKKTNGFIRFTAEEGDWVAFSIKKPDMTGELCISITHPTTTTGAEACDVYILAGKLSKNSVINAMLSAEKIGTVRYHNANVTSGGADCPNVSVSTSTVGLWTPGAAEEYTLVLKAAKAYEGNTAANMYITNLVMSSDTNTVKNAKAVVYNSATDGQNTTTYHASDAAVTTAINSAASGDRIILLDDVTSAADITIPAGVTLDLNGKTLNANVNDAAGTLMDSSGGDGKVKAATLASVGSDQMVLADGDYLRIFDYTLTTPADPVEVSEDGDSVQFWFDVRFDNAAAYDVVAAGNSGFSVGANFQWNENAAVKADFGENLSVEDWAAKMKLSPNYSFYVKVAGLKNAVADGTLTVLPTVSGKQGTGSITSGLTHTVIAAQ